MLPSFILHILGMKLKEWSSVWSLRSDFSCQEKVSQKRAMSWWSLAASTITSSDSNSPTSTSASRSTTTRTSIRMNAIQWWTCLIERICGCYLVFVVSVSWCICGCSDVMRRTDWKKIMSYWICEMKLSFLTVDVNYSKERFISNTVCTPNNFQTNSWEYLTTV